MMLINFNSMQKNFEMFRFESNIKEKSVCASNPKKLEREAIYSKTCKKWSSLKAGCHERIKGSSDGPQACEAGRVAMLQSL